MSFKKVRVSQIVLYQVLRVCTVLPHAKCIVSGKRPTKIVFTRRPSFLLRFTQTLNQALFTMAGDDDSFASSDSSDDEFLTMKEGGGNQDRDALIRKKLMESFYGKTIPDAAASASKSDDEDSDDDVAKSEGGDDRDPKDGDGDNMALDDLDSPYFDPNAHTTQHVMHSNMHNLLETEERLALQVRTLDSTMQTLVYENYSKFIDATDAIRSIGVSVHANEEGLARLSTGMETIHDKSREVEDALGGLRDQVAEKLRVKKLLTRLDTLLKLPKTLNEHIGQHKYRLATTSYVSAYAILSKHSKGFESLKNIEVECNGILTRMVATLKNKLSHWSGQIVADNIRNRVDTDMSGDFASYDEDDLVNEPEKPTAEEEEEEDGEWAPPPIPPQSISEVFECAGTLLMLLPNEGNADDDGGITFSSDLTPNDCKSLALAASFRFLERVLDSHHVELQESIFGDGFDEDTYETKLNNIAHSAESSLTPDAPKGSKLIPTLFLDNALEVVTLFGISLSPGGVSDLSGSDKLLVMNFLTDVFSAFLSHVRSVLMEQSLKTDPEGEVGNADNNDNMADDDDGDLAYGEISGAMTHFRECVGNFASGLALPQVGIDPQFASGLVEQAVEITESMVRRRVAQKFFSLRLRVVKDCIRPFAEEAIKVQDNTANSGTPRVVQVVQMASVALSDGLQMVDDTIKSILTGGVVVAELKGVDFAMVSEAVQGFCLRFALWLAATLEVLAGCQSCDSNVTIEAGEAGVALGDDETEDEATEIPGNTSFNAPDDLSAISDKNDAIADKVEMELNELLNELEAGSLSSSARYNVTIAIAEMCRLAERSVMENISQSISSSQGGGRRHKSSDLFHSRSAKAILSDDDNKACERFKLAASRALGHYAVNRGFDAAMLICAGFSVMATSNGEDLPKAPRECIWQGLEVVKLTCIDCSNVFGGESFFEPVQDVPEDESDFLNTGAPLSLGRHMSGHVKGLQLDVERMFMERKPTYPHPSQILEFTRSAVVTIVLNIAINSLSELTRSCTFTTKGYRQLQVDVAFLKHMLSHYVKDDFLAEGSNSLTTLDTMLNSAIKTAGNRCADMDCVGQDKYFDPVTGVTTSVRSILRKFMNSASVTAISGADSDDEGEPVENIFSRFVITDTKIEI
jgi:vacuolar protein sorting-associated protein 51